MYYIATENKNGYAVGQLVSHENTLVKKLKCDGDIYNKSDYKELCSILPSYFKFGDKFSVPDLKGKILRFEEIAT